MERRCKLNYWNYSRRWKQLPGRSGLIILAWSLMSVLIAPFRAQLSVCHIKRYQLADPALFLCQKCKLYNEWVIYSETTGLKLVKQLNKKFKKTGLLQLCLQTCGCHLHTQRWLQKVWNPVNTGSWRKGVLTIYKRPWLFSSAFSTRFFFFLTLQYDHDNYSQREQLSVQRQYRDLPPLMDLVSDLQDQDVVREAKYTGATSANPCIHAKLSSHSQRKPFHSLCSAEQ